MGKPFDLVAIPKECPEGKIAENPQTFVAKVDFLFTNCYILTGFFDRFFSNSDQMLAEILSIFFYFY